MKNAMKVFFVISSLLMLSNSMCAQSKSVVDALKSKTEYVQVRDYKMAYRSMGKGSPIILCNRFRGTMDSWDPAFLNMLATQYNVITFDYPGTASSKGELPTTMAGVASEVVALANALGFKKFIIAGWSYGGMVAQTMAVLYPDPIMKVIIFGTNPPGQPVVPTEAIFLQKSGEWDNDLADEEILFFEPNSTFSRKAAQLSHDRIAGRKSDIDVLVQQPVWPRYFEGVKSFYEDKDDVRTRLGKAPFPILMVAGDHDIANFVENWFALNRKLPNVQLMVMPQSGHGPQHQYPELVANYMMTFLKFSSKP